jgi:Mor family transcriptional regulator
MSGRQSAAVALALKAYKKGDKVYPLAKKYGVSPSHLYRILKRKK